EKNLTIAHIAPYLPYGLQYKSLMNGSINELRDLSVEAELTDWMRPILRPLSQLTEEIEHNGERFVPIDRINGRLRSKIPRNIEVNQSVNNQNVFFVLTEWISFEQLYELFNMLFEWHFDVFGLIDSGLAIEE